ncbi:hypothetical protein [Pseudactinotalea terrae]|uniref:hypothetical protein n=1 Tax=Pseudactinotalea terrae TaxID=1743262 RepID=UPI0012E0F568|nr:hypothetical protein [Pseudactinotalea terrae]
MPTRCPECGSGDVVEIVYGMPGPELFEAAERGEVVLGGCVMFVDPDGQSADPDRSCRDCHHRFARPRRRRPSLT